MRMRGGPAYRAPLCGCGCCWLVVVGCGLVGEMRCFVNRVVSELYTPRGHGIDVHTDSPGARLKTECPNRRATRFFFRHTRISLLLHPTVMCPFCCAARCVHIHQLPRSFVCSLIALFHDWYLCTKILCYWTFLKRRPQCGATKPLFKTSATAGRPSYIPYRQRIFEWM